LKVVTKVKVARAAEVEKEKVVLEGLREMHSSSHHTPV
jgi:hypothetical protein